jgi:hypothetical protein
MHWELSPNPDGMAAAMQFGRATSAEETRRGAAKFRMGAARRRPAGLEAMPKTQWNVPPDALRSKE